MDGKNHKYSKCKTMMLVALVVIVVCLLVWGMCKFIRKRNSSCGSCSSARRSAAIADASTDGGVYHAKSEEDAMRKIEENDVVVVLFFADWCPHCMTMKPAFESASKKTHAMHVVYVAMDADKQTDMMNDFGVQGVPAMLRFEKGRSSPSEYQGPRTEESIVAFANGEHHY